MKHEAVQGESPIGNSQSPKGREASVVLAAGPTVLEMVFDGERERLLACILRHPVLSLGTIQRCFALGQGTWSEHKGLARRWSVWAVLCDAAWAEQQIRSGAGMPETVGFVFVNL